MNNLSPFFSTDKRVENWFLMQAYTPTLVITAVYVLFVTWIGPQFMEKREPFKLKWPIVIYNAICVAINYHICSSVSYYLDLYTWILCIFLNILEKKKETVDNTASMVHNK